MQSVILRSNNRIQGTMHCGSGSQTRELNTPHV